MASTRITKWEFQQPLDICPEVHVWKKIGQYLTGPYDLLNFAKSSSDIDNILLEIYPSLHFIDIFHHVAPYLELKYARRCRQVCRHWNLLFTAHLEFVYGSVNTFFDCLVPNQKLDQGQVNLRSLVALDSWEDTMMPSLTNPVACRTICIEPDLKMGIKTFFVRSLHIFSTWGHLIWNLTFNFERFEALQNRRRHTPQSTTILDILEFIQNCLRHVPNLKTLNLDSLQWAGNGVKPEKVDDWVATHPFPPLPFLRHFNIVPFLINVSIWEGLVVAYQSHLESLSVRIFVRILTNRSIALPRLTKLCLHLKATEISVILGVAERSSWSLKNLDVTLGLSSKLTLEQKKSFHQLLQHSQSTLEVLSIWLNTTYRDSPGETFFPGCSLPNLKSLEINVIDLHSLDFVVDFSPNLKHLTVREGDSTNFVNPTRKRRSPKILNLYEPNGVWSRLRSLETIDIYWSRDKDFERVCHCVPSGHKFRKYKSPENLLNL